MKKGKEMVGNCLSNCCTICAMFLMLPCEGCIAPQKPLEKETNIAGVSSVAVFEEHLDAPAMEATGDACNGSFAITNQRGLLGVINCRVVGGSVSVVTCEDCVLDGIWTRLEKVKGNFDFHRIIGEKRIGDFPELSRVEGSLAIWAVLRLKEIGTFASLEFIGGDLSIGVIDEMEKLPSMPRLKAIEGSLHVSGVDKLKSFQPLDSVERIGADFWIQGNRQLVEMSGMDNVKEIGGVLLLEENGAIATLSGLNSVKAVKGHLDIINNEALTTINGLSSLEEIGGDLFVHSNINLDPREILSLKELKRINGDVVICNNRHIPSVKALRNRLKKTIEIKGKITVRNEQCGDLLMGPRHTKDVLEEFETIDEE